MNQKQKIYAASVSVWIEDHDQDEVYANVEKIIDAINATDVPCSISEDVHDYETA